MEFDILDGKSRCPPVPYMTTCGIICFVTTAVASWRDFSPDGSWRLQPRLLRVPCCWLHRDGEVMLALAHFECSGTLPMSAAMCAVLRRQSEQADEWILLLWAAVVIARVR